MEKRLMNNLRNYYLFTETAVKAASNLIGIDDEYFFDELIFLLTGCKDGETNIFLASMPNNMTAVKFSLFHAAMVTDFYIKLNCNKWMNLDKDDIKMINDVRNAIIERRTNELFEDKCIFLVMRNIFINFFNIAGLDKVILYKSLTERDITLLSNFNPLFMDEYKHFDVTVDMEFIKKQFELWKKQFGEDAAYNAICDFICKLYRIDIEQVSNVVVELADTDDEMDELILNIDEMNFNSIKENLINYFSIHNDVRKK